MQKKTLYGIVCVLICALTYSVQVSIIKLYSNNISPFLLVFLQSIIGLAILIPLICIKNKSLHPLKILTFSNVKTYHLIKTIAGVSISYLIYGSLKFLPYFDSILIYNTFPLFIPFASLFLLKQKINHKLWPFIILGFFGVSLTLSIDRKIFSIAALLTLLAAFCSSVSIVKTRKVMRYDDALKTLYYYLLYCSLISFILFLPHIKELLHVNWLTIIIIGVLFFISQYFLNLSSNFVGPQIVANTFYSNIIFSIFVSYFVFGNTITFKSILGMLCIVLGGIGVIYFQNISFSKIKN